MVATFTRGYSFAAGGDHTVNAADLHALIEAAGLSGVSRSNLQRPPNFLCLTRSSRPTDLAVNEPWMDSTSLCPMTLRADGLHVPLRPGAIPYFLSPSSAAVVSGDLLSTKEVKDATTGIPHLTMGISANKYRIVGVAAHPLNPGEQGVCVVRGLTNVSFEASEAGDDFGAQFTQSSTQGKAKIGLSGSEVVLAHVGILLSNISASTLLATCIVRR